MASQINASNSGFGGIVSTGDSSGVLQLQTTGTTAVTIDTSQNVGIGTTSPNGKFESYANSGYSVIANSSAGSVAINPSSNAILFGTTNVAAYATGNYDAATHVYKTSGTERMRIDSSGNLLVGTSSVVPTETGVVIQQNNSTNHATVTYKYTASPSSSATVTFNTSSLGFSGSIYYCVEVTASAYGNSNTGVGTYKGMVTGFSGLSGSYQAVTNIVSAMTSTGSFTLAGGTNQVILTITNTNGSQAKFGVVRFDVTWGG